MKKRKILFCGFRHGHIDALYRKVVASQAAEIAGCIEPDAAARAAAEQKLGAVFSDKSYADWLAEDIDAVAVGLAYGDRGEAIIRALEAGKHVIADKPVCTDLGQLERIAALTREKGLTLACMLDLRYLPQTLRAAELLRGGELGEVRNIAFNGQHCIDYAHRPSWYFAPGMHGGTINDLAIHGIDLVRMLTGMEITAVDAARTWNAYADRTPDFRDCAAFMARLENGAGLLADISYSAPTQVFTLPTYWEFRIWCARGMLSFNYVSPVVTVYAEGRPEPLRCDGIPPAGDYLDEFLDSIAGKGGQAVTEHVLSSTACALRIQQIADGDGDPKVLGDLIRSERKTLS